MVKSLLLHGKRQAMAYFPAMQYVKQFVQQSAACSSDCLGCHARCEGPLTLCSVIHGTGPWLSSICIAAQASLLGY